MGRRWRALATIVFLAACVGSGLGWAFWRPAFMVQGKKSAPSPPVIVLPEGLDFHTVWESDTFHWEVVLENRSPQPVTVRSVHAGCDCDSSRTEGGKDVVLNPGERVAVRLTLDLLRLQTHDPAEVRALEVPLIVTLDNAAAGVATCRWPLRGRVRRLITCEPLHLGLGDELVCGEPGRPREFRLHANIPHQQLRLKQSPEGWKATLLPVVGDARAYVLRASACKRKIGPFADLFLLEVIDVDGQTHPIQPIKVEGRVTDGLEVLPRPLDLGEVSVGTTAHARVWVSMRSDDQIEAVEPAQKDQAARWVASRPDGEKWQIDLERVVDTPGGGSCSGVFRVKLHAGGWREAEYFLQWYGIRK